MNWFALSVAGTFAFAISNLLVKFGLHHHKVDPVAFGSAFQLIVAAYAIPWILLQPPLMPANLALWGLGVLSCFFYTLATFFWFRAIKAADVSEVSILLGTRPLWVLLAGIPLAREAVSAFKFVTMLVIIAGLVIVFYERGKFRFGGPQRMAFLATLSFSGAALIDSYLASLFSTNIYVLLTFSLPALGLLVMEPSAIRGMGSLFGRRASVGLLSSAFMVFLSVNSLLLSYRYGEPSRVLAVYQLSVVITVLLGALFLGERGNLPRKLAGSLLVAVGVAFMRV